ncbi:hypothetical protein [Streptomyces dysideae]|uniref:Uncharacterized protein n=1 Tax=Streptomyces dysideae TaxID=909626 RepID=A0A101UQN5_9ACTN|nr:hypothetical protein [Streptomyces dysideae]KUO15098.1 hypothetical protein AQJ91_43025 [Streptomyces dysideae]
MERDRTNPAGGSARTALLRGELAQDESMVRRFRCEADAASAVRGPGVAPVLRYDLDGPVPLVTGRGVLCPGRTSPPTRS